jgi:heat shock protein 110kDa
MPAMKHLIEIIFGKTASTTLNQDEAVSRGAALQCAILSPAVRVRDFSTTDILNYSVKCVWEDEKEQKSLDIFPRHHQAPFSRLLTVYKREPFTVQLQYAEQIPFASPFIGELDLIWKYSGMFMFCRFQANGMCETSNRMPTVRPKK